MTSLILVCGFRWAVLRQFGYTDDFNLQPTYINPPYVTLFKQSRRKEGGSRERPMVQTKAAQQCSIALFMIVIRSKDLT